MPSSTIHARRTLLSLAVGVGVLLTCASAAFAQQTAGMCPSGKRPLGTLGITGLSCNCSFTTDSADRSERWVFRTEPVVMSLAASGPGDGILQVGDRIAAVDGQLITTTAGGVRWGRILPGESVSLMIRRGDALLNVVVRAGAHCPGDSRAALPATPPAETERPSRLLPRGWMGFGLACDCSVNAGGAYALWTFRSPPDVSLVSPNGPAARAGIQSGDRLLEIGGVRLDSPEGGRAFSLVKPGDTVRFLIERAGTRRMVRLVAEEMPTRS
jgi:S1-C subfamily serine protease